MRIILAVGCILAASCGNSDVRQEIKPGKNYRHNLVFSVNGYAYKGVASVDTAKDYVVDTALSTRASFIRYSSCHRDIPKETSLQRDVFRYKPTDIEKVSCPLLVEVILANSKKQTGLVHLPEEGLTGEAGVICNGFGHIFQGSTACQGRQGTVQKIKTQTKGKIRSSCEVREVPDGWEVTLPSGYCTAVFGQRGNLASVLFYGYDDIILEGF